jgi:hypothetical protein
MRFALQNQSSGVNDFSEGEDIAPVAISVSL